LRLLLSLRRHRFLFVVLEIIAVTEENTAATPPPPPPLLLPFLIMSLCLTTRGFKTRQ
jgi:hypothetical protein